MDDDTLRSMHLNQAIGAATTGTGCLFSIGAVVAVALKMKTVIMPAAIAAGAGALALGGSCGCFVAGRVLYESDDSNEDTNTLVQYLIIIATVLAGLTMFGSSYAYRYFLRGKSLTWGFSHTIFVVLVVIGLAGFVSGVVSTVSVSRRSQE